MSASRLDVAVVGAGAAGAAAAYHLALRGHSVAVIEPGPFPRPKPCGGGMAASVQRWFPCDLSPVVDRVIDRVRFTWCLDDPVIADLPGESPFWIVTRLKLDAYLLNQAQNHGAELLMGFSLIGIERDQGGWRLQLKGSGGEQSLCCAALVLANGSKGNFAHQLGLGDPQPRLASALAVDLDGEVLEETTARFEFGLLKNGFCWCFPRLGGYSIGVGTFLGKTSALHSNDLATNYDQVLSKLLPSLGFEATAGRRRPWPLRVWNGHYPLHGDAVLAVGDAASLADPFLAEGLRPALLSGLRSAEALHQWFGGDPNALAGYSATMRSEWGESMQWGRRIGQVFYRFPKVGYQLGIKRPTAPQRIAQILSGEMGYGDIAQRVIRRLMFGFK